MKDGNLQRVADNIGARVLKFARSRAGKEFYSSELLTYVRLRFPLIAPDSPGRILRQLRSAGKVEYHVLSRNMSRYRVDGVAAGGSDCANTK